MRDQTDSRTRPLSLGRPPQKRTGQSGAAFLPPMKPCELQELEFQREKLARRERAALLSCFSLPLEESALGTVAGVGLA